MRQAIPRLHAYLRDCILDGRLPLGTKLSQVALAEQLGVSRTPPREVLRMLQEEDLVEFAPNQRMRVAGLDPVELDGEYACRILLETLALSMTLNSLGPRERRQAGRLLASMRRAARSAPTAVPHAVALAEGSAPATVEAARRSDEGHRHGTAAATPGVGRGTPAPDR